MIAQDCAEQQKAPEKSGAFSFGFTEIRESNYVLYMFSHMEGAMTFKPGDRVSIKGFGIPKTVMDINGDDIAVLEYDTTQNIMRRQTYKADVLQHAPRPRAMGLAV